MSNDIVYTITSADKSGILLSKTVLIKERKNANNQLLGLQEWYENGTLIHSCDCDETLNIGNGADSTPQKINFSSRINDGIEWVKMFINAGILNGAHITRYDRGPNIGLIKHKHLYKQGKRHGKQSDYALEYGIAIDSFYVNGTKHGDEINYSLYNGTVNCKSIYYMGDKISSTYYHLHGGVKCVEIYKNGDMLGEVVHYYPGGNLEQRFVYGSEHGINSLKARTRWYRNGHIRVHARYKDDKLNGDCIYWYDNGFLEKHEYYYNDMLSGPFTAWSESGTITCKCFYVDDNLHGRYKRWNRITGDLTIDESYFHGIRYPRNLKNIQRIYRRSKLATKLTALAAAREFIELWWHPESKGGFFAKKNLETALQAM